MVQDKGFMFMEQVCLLANFSKLPMLRGSALKDWAVIGGIVSMLP